MMHILRLLPAAAGALAIAACAPCPIPQTQPAPAPPASQPPAPLHPSRVEPGDTQMVAADTPRVARVQIGTTQGGAAGQFAPRVVRARRGDLLRFTMTDGLAVHNVSFTYVQDDGRGVPLPADSPMLTQKGQSWQLRVDLPPGTYAFACIPHAMVEMHGTLIVEP